MSTTLEQLVRQAQTLDHAANQGTDETTRVIFRMAHTMTVMLATALANPENVEQLAIDTMATSRELLADAVNHGLTTLPKKRN